MYFIFRFAYNVCTIAFSWVLDAYILQWATDQDIANAIADIGVTDFQDVKFFENRANGQSKGFCVISLGSDQSIRMVMDRLPKKEIHGQHPVVTLPTKQVTTSKFLEAWSRLFKFNNIFNKNDFLFVLQWAQDLTIHVNFLKSICISESPNATKLVFLFLTDHNFFGVYSFRNDIKGTWCEKNIESEILRNDETVTIDQRFTALLVLAVAK